MPNNCPTGASRTPPWLLSGWEHQDRHPSTPQENPDRQFDSLFYRPAVRKLFPTPTWITLAGKIPGKRSNGPAVSETPVLPRLVCAHARERSPACKENG